MLHTHAWAQMLPVVRRTLRLRLPFIRVHPTRSTRVTPLVLTSFTNSVNPDSAGRLDSRVVSLRRDTSAHQEVFIGAYVRPFKIRLGFLRGLHLSG